MSLGFREKNAIAKQLENNVYLPQDRLLLKRYLPSHELLFRSPSSSRPNISFEIIFLLLDFVDKQTIESNRKGEATSEKQLPTSSNVTKLRESKGKKEVKKKSQRKKNIQISIGPALRNLKSEMHTRSTLIGSILTEGCVSLMTCLKRTPPQGM